MKVLWIVGALLTLPGAPAWAVNKCMDADGKVVYQDAACTFKGKEVNVQPNSGMQLTTPPPRLGASEMSPFANGTGAGSPVNVQSPDSAPPPQPQSALSLEANMCLDWYRPKLRNPAGAYVSQPSKEGTVLSMKVHATNGYGGYEILDAACEMRGGRLDPSWTQIHATRRGWPAN